MRRELTDHYKVWTPWFAWLPVVIGNVCVWGEMVERRKKTYGYDYIWEHRFSPTVPTVSALKESGKTC